MHSQPAVRAERAMLAALGGGCQMPIAALGVPCTRRMVNDQGLFQLFLMDPNDVKIELNFANSEVAGVRPELMASELPGDKQ